MGELQLEAQKWQGAGDKSGKKDKKEKAPKEEKEKPPKEEKKAKKKEEEPVEEMDAADEALAAEPKEKDPFLALPPG